ncbi:transcription factor A, mitochondrial-like [Amphiura filiformis]|uniref:transcription factor A, mitochondrial-like n=1 Tax=Amphiura filiformis TaxID=82378 RepID=UPI003B226AC7
MAASLQVMRSLAKFSGLFINESRFSLTKSTKVCGSWHQSCYLSTDHPSMPKKPSSVYFLFIADVRPEVQAENPDAKMSEIGKKVGELWRKLSDNEKKVYKERFEANMKTYKIDMEKFKDSITADEWADIQKERNDKIAATKEKKKRREKRDRKQMLEREGKPKPIPTNYAMFVQDQFKDNPSVTIDQCAVLWRNLTAAEKEAYKERYKQARADYDAALEKWKKQMIDEGKLELIETPKSLKKSKSKKKKPAKSAKKKKRKL